MLNGPVARVRFPAPATGSGRGRMLGWVPDVMAAPRRQCGFLRRSGWIDASWVDNGTVLLSDPYLQPNEDTVLWSPDDKPTRCGAGSRTTSTPATSRRRRSSRDRSALATVTSGGREDEHLDDGRRVLSPTTRRAASRPRSTSRARSSRARRSPPTARGCSGPTAADGIHTAALPRFGVDDVRAARRTAASCWSRARRARRGDRPRCRRRARARRRPPRPGKERAGRRHAPTQARVRRIEADPHQGQARRRAQEGPRRCA